MLEKSSHHGVICKYIRAWNLRKQPSGIVNIAVSRKAEDFNECKREGRARKVGMSENVGVDLIEYSHVRTFLNY